MPSENLTPLLKVGLPVYLVVFFFSAFFWRSYQVWRRTGVNPYVLGSGDDAHGYIGRLFRLTLGAVVLIVSVYLVSEDLYAYLTPIPWLAAPAVTTLGLALLILALLWVWLAQAQMGDAWRIGVDADRATPLVQHGLFGVSRNPIFLGLLGMLVGFFMALPNALSLVVVVLGYALVQIQVRLEEAHLARLHGDAYRDYCQRVRRWL